MAEVFEETFVWFVDLKQVDALYVKGLLIASLCVVPSSFLVELFWLFGLRDGVDFLFLQMV